MSSLEQTAQQVMRMVAVGLGKYTQRQSNADMCVDEAGVHIDTVNGVILVPIDCDLIVRDIRALDECIRQAIPRIMYVHDSDLVVSMQASDNSPITVALHVAVVRPDTSTPLISKQGTQPSSKVQHKSCLRTCALMTMMSGLMVGLSTAAIFFFNTKYGIQWS
jgi:hypothetical protein